VKACLEATEVERRLAELEIAVAHSEQEPQHYRRDTSLVFLVQGSGQLPSHSE
jgi:hypothetical protein